MRQHSLKRLEETLGDIRIDSAQEIANERRRIGVSAAEEAKQRRAAFLDAAGLLERRDEHRAEDVLAGELRTERGLEAFKQGQTVLVETVEATSEHRVDQRVLAAEVIVHGGQVCIGASGDEPHRHAFVTGVDEERFGGVEQASLGVAGYA